MTATAAATTARRYGIAPTRSEALDLGMVMATGLVAMLGFRDTFVDWTFLAAGAVGLLLGTTVAHVSHVLRQPVVVTAVFTIAAFFLVGGAIALRGDGPFAALPVPGTLARLADESVHGWKELLTTLPPVDGGPLLTLPYLLGLVAGAGGVALALRFRWPVAPALVMVMLIAVVVLLGVRNPGHVALTGLLFGLLLLGWVILRARRIRRTTHFDRRRTRQRLTAALLCAGAATLAVVSGPHLPGVAGDRVVLRSHVQPPFDVGQYPSPLASFRIYTDAITKNVHDKVLFTVSGVRPNTLIRLATLDAYNGTVWGAANDAGTDVGAADTYQKVGSVIRNPQEGAEVSGRVTIGAGYDGVWLPTVGALREIHFTSSRLRAAGDHFRYNLAASSGVMPDGLRPGDSYRFVASVPPRRELTPQTRTAAQPLVDPAGAQQFQATAQGWAGGSGGTPMGEVLGVAAYLHTNGAFSDGANGEYSLPGHSLSRLKAFAAPDLVPTGDDEQYAAAMALMANQLGVPARVVLGASLPSDGVVRGKDVHAWIEVRTQGGAWQTLTQDKFMGDKPPETHQQPKPQLAPGITVPPPVPVRPPSTVGDPATDALNRHATEKGKWHFEVPGWLVTAAKYVGTPVLVLLAALGLIVLVKSQRRRLRRTRGAPTRRLAQAYRELLDQARDIGHRVHAGRTRREQAAQVGVDGVMALARSADAKVFGPGEPTSADASAYWTEVDAMRRELTAGLSRWQRLKAAANLASLRPLAKEGTVA